MGFVTTVTLHTTPIAST